MLKGSIDEKDLIDFLDWLVKGAGDPERFLNTRLTSLLYSHFQGLIEISIEGERNIVVQLTAQGREYLGQHRIDVEPKTTSFREDI